MSKRHTTETDLIISDDPLWYKDAIIYELHVRAFSDSNGDGIGDFEGLVSKLDYLQDLGVTALWLLPFYPSPLRDDGYDIADYSAVNPAYGTLVDFRRFLKEAHQRGLRVITELVINHTSAEHPWFQRARRAPPGSKYRDFYVWSDTPNRYTEARIIFSDFETSNWTWDPVANAYYWHRFYSHQPDLNFDNPDVHKAVFKALDFWMDMGVDGLRLDAIPYLFEREGTNCENLPETHVFLKKLRAHMDRKHQNRLFLAEANQWPEDAAAYFGDGDECHMNFHFPLMPRMFMAVQMENNFPILDILDQTPEIPENCQWALFLRNHDELTLEMVTDEDRDYMYRMYVDEPQARINLGIRRRLAPLLKLRRKIELMHGLLFSLPGTPVLYYGDEIGMGDNIYLGDRDGVRTPMQWSYDRNAGFSRANPQKLYLPVIIDPEYHYEAINVEAQQNNASSLLWWVKRLIALRKQYQVFGRGTVRFFRPEQSSVLVFMRSQGSERVLVVANLSRFSQGVEIDLSEYAGLVPVEMFGRIRFPAITEQSYFLSLGPHSFYWFELEQPGADHGAEAAREIPQIEVTRAWENLISTGRRQSALEKVLPGYLQTSRWFRSKARKISSAKFVDIITIPIAEDSAYLALVQVSYVQETPDVYLLPMAYAQGERALHLEHDSPQAVIARVKIKPARGSGGEVHTGVIYDATRNEDFARALLEMFSRRKAWPGQGSELTATALPAFRSLRGPAAQELKPRVLTAEQTNTSIAYGDAFVLKLNRLVESGIQPELEVGRYFSEVSHFEHVPPLAGALEYQARGSRAVVGILQKYVPNQGDAWRFTLDSLRAYFDHALSLPEKPHDVDLGPSSLLDRSRLEIPQVVREVIGPYLALMRVLGERSAEMHMALTGPADSDFASEPFSTLYQRSLYQASRIVLLRSFDLLDKRLETVPEEWRDLAGQILGTRKRLDAQLKNIAARRIDTLRTRCHGDYHLGQVLYTGNDFVIIDFEGEPARPIGERRIKRSPLRDVAGMLRSFHYAAMFAAHDRGPRPVDMPELERWAEIWHRWVSAAYLSAYLQRIAGSGLLPDEDGPLSILLDFYLLDKCVHELAYELNNRPEWVWVPLLGLRQLLDVEWPETSGTSGSREADRT
jgi:maltose alpha-D-glucosyltransferase / alpha-amylase